MKKTLVGWRQSGQELGQYLQVGDLVDEALFNHFLNVLPPAYHSSSIVQIGEPVDQKEWGPVFATLERTANGWVYRGNCYYAQTDSTLPPR